MTKIIIEEVIEWIKTRNETTQEDIQIHFNLYSLTAKTVYDIIKAQYPHIFIRAKPQMTTYDDDIDYL